MANGTHICISIEMTHFTKAGLAKNTIVSQLSKCLKFEAVQGD